MIVGEGSFGLGDGFYLGSQGFHDLCYLIDQLAVVHCFDHLGHLDELLVDKGCRAEVAVLIKDITRDLLACGFLKDIDDGEA